MEFFTLTMDISHLSPFIESYRLKTWPRRPRISVSSNVDVVVAAMSLWMFLASYCGGHSGAAETPTKSHDLRSTATDVANFEPSQMWSSEVMDAAAYELQPFLYLPACTSLVYCRSCISNSMSVCIPRTCARFMFYVGMSSNSSCSFRVC